MRNKELIKEGETFVFSTDKNLLNIAYVHQYLSGKSYWAKNIPYALVETSIEHSLCFGVYTQGHQIGFARVITDYASFGYLADVFVDEQYRGKKLSVELMQFIMEHPDMHKLRRFSLFTQDAHGLYEKFGFGPAETPQNYMEIRKKNPYSAA